MKRKVSMLLASLFLVVGTTWAQVYQKVPHNQWTVTALNEAYVQGNEGGVAFLKDENPATFYHSDYNNAYADGNSGRKKGQDGLQAFMVELPEVTTFDRITYKGRANGGNNWSTKARIYVFENLPTGWPTDGENLKQLSALTYAEKEDLLKRTDNTVLGTPAFDNNETGTWAADQNIKTVEFASPQQGKYILFVADETTGGNGYFCCADFNLWQKLEGIEEDKPYFLKISGVDGNYYLDTRVGESSNFGNTISKTEIPVATYFTLVDGYWHISSFPGHEKHFVNIANWDATVGQDTPANWQLYKDEEHSLWSLAQSTYYGGGDALKHYLGANDGDIAGKTKVYADKAISQAVKFELVELDEMQTAIENARIVLSHMGAGYPAADSEARITLQAAIDADDATVESINEAIAVYQDNTQTVVMPEVGKVYRLVSGYTAFGSDKAMYSENSELRWQEKDNAAMNQLWTVQSIADGNITLMNVNDAMYPQKSNFGESVRMFSVKNECSIEFLGKGQFKVCANKSQGLHTNGHSNGAGVSGNIINYNTGVDGASAWYFEEVAVNKDILSKLIESVKTAYVDFLLVEQTSVVDLADAVETAEQACDAEGCNYAEAFAALTTAVDATTVEYIDLGYFYMKAKGSGRYAYNDGEDLKTGTEKSEKAIFRLTKANNGTFYIQNANGLYAQNVTQSGQTKIATEKVEYTINRLGSGYYVLRPTSLTGTRQFWHQDGSNNVVGWETGADNTQWTFEPLDAEELEKIYTVKGFYTNSADVYVTYNGEYNGDADVKQAGGFYVLDETPQSSDFTITNIATGKVFVNGNSLYVNEGYDATNIYTLRCMKGNSYARYHSGSQLNADDSTNMLTYEGNLYLESFFYVEEGTDDYEGYYTIRSVAAPTMYAYNLGTANENSKVAMKEAPEGGLTSDYYWKISNFGSKETSNITPWGEGGDAFGWNKRGSYNGYNHIGYWQGGNGTEDNKWYVNIVRDELVEKFIPLHTVANSVVGYATYESVEAVLPYTEVVTAEGLNNLKNAQFNVVAPQTGKYYRLKNEASGLYMSGEEDNIRLVEKENLKSTIFYLDKNYALKSHNTGRYLDCQAKSYATGENKPAGTFGFAYGGKKPNVITYCNNGCWTFGANNKGDGLLDRGSSTPNQTGYNWVLEEGDVDVWEAKAKLVSLMEELYDPWALSLPLQVEKADSVYYLSSCGSADGNVVSHMLDGDPSTFYGSPWLSSVGSKHYWQVDLGDGVTLSEFVFSYTTRANGSDIPAEITVVGSNDGVAFNDTLATITEGLPSTASGVYKSETISNVGGYRYLRFYAYNEKGYKAGGAEGESTIAIAEFEMWHHTKPIMDAAQAVVDDKATTLDEVNQVYQNLRMMTVEKPVYPFTVTTNDESPTLYAIKSGRADSGKEWWYTYDSEDGKIALSQYTGEDKQLWFFKEVITEDYQYALQLYPYADPTKAMSYENTENAAAKIVAKELGTTGWTNLWLSVSTNNGAPYGLQTYDKNNYLSNNGGYTNKMGMWNAAPSADDGTAMYFSTPTELLLNLIEAAKIKAVSGHDGEVGYYTAETAEVLRSAISQAETNLENKDYSVEGLNTAIANLSLILPQAGKYYQIKSANPDFYKKQGKEMGIYSSNDQGQLAWKALDASDKSFYWTITPKDGKFVLKNEADGKYVPAIAGDAYAMTETEADAAEFTLTWLTPGQFNINGNGTMHMAGHTEGAGTGDRICNWGGGINSSSAWTIVEVVHPDLVIAKASLQIRIDELKYMSEYVGTDPGCYKVSEIEKLVDPLAIAENVMGSGSEEPETYTKALAALNEAIASFDLEIIPVTAGCYRIVSAHAGFTEAKGITCYSKDEYHGDRHYPGWAAVNENDPLQYWTLEDAGEGKFNIKAAYEGNYIATATSMTSESKAATFTSIGNGQFNITLDGDEKPLHCMGWNWSNTTQASLTTYEGAANSASAWKLVTVTETPEFTYELNVSEAGYATLMLAYNAEIPDGVVCYTVEVDEDAAVMTAITGGVLLANTPVIIKAEEGAYRFVSTDKDAVAPVVNELVGTLYPKFITPGENITCYVLSNSTNGVGLYKAALNKLDGTAFLNNANKIYLPVGVPEAQAARALVFRFRREDTTDIDNAQMTIGNDNAVIYDLTGRRVEKMVEKGIYIVNGVKVVID